MTPTLTRDLAAARTAVLDARDARDATALAMAVVNLGRRAYLIRGALWAPEHKADAADVAARIQRAHDLLQEQVAPHSPLPSTLPGAAREALAALE